MQTDADLEKHFSSSLARSIILCITNTEITDADLTPSEKLRLAEQKHEQKQKSWRRGRHALKSILMRAGDEQSQMQQIDTTLLTVPHPKLSLSHSGDLAIAIYCLDTTNGAGVDIEKNRVIKEGSDKFFLSTTERDWLNSQEQEQKHQSMMRLWTVKEAVFKSDLQNDGKTLLKYFVEDPSHLHGKATDEYGSRAFIYNSINFDGYWLTIAVAE